MKIQYFTEIYISQITPKIVIADKIFEQIKQNIFKLQKIIAQLVLSTNFIMHLESIQISEF